MIGERINPYLQPLQRLSQSGLVRVLSLIGVFIMGIAVARQLLPSARLSGLGIDQQVTAQVIESLKKKDPELNVEELNVGFLIAQHMQSLEKNLETRFNSESVRHNVTQFVETLLFVAQEDMIPYTALDLLKQPWACLQLAAKDLQKDDQIWIANAISSSPNILKQRVEDVLSVLATRPVSFDRINPKDCQIDTEFDISELDI